MKRIALIAMLLNVPASHADELEDILATLASRPLVRAAFTQEKSAPGLSKPLLSAGTLVFSRDDGVLLSMQTPSPSVLVMNDDTIVQKAGGRQTRLRLGRSPYAAVASVLSDLGSGDPARLLASFEVESVSRSGRAWDMRLRPRDAKLQKLLARMDLAGDECLRKLAIEDAQGGTTTLSLAECRTEPALTDEERALFRLAH